MEIVDKRISFTTAKLAKEKRFDIACSGSYTEYLVDQVDPDYPEGGGAFTMTKGEIELASNYFINNDERCDYTCKSYAMYAAPTQALLAKWLREVHNIQVYVNSHTKDGNGKYRDYVAHVNNREINDARDTEFQTYEEAMEIGLQAALREIQTS